MTNKLGPARSWRLIHDGGTVLMLEQLSGITETVNQAFEAKTLGECLAEIGRLGLPVPDTYAVLSTPESVSPRQIREALIDSGLIDAVEAGVAAGDRKLKNWWEFSTSFERSNQHVIDMGVTLGVTALQLDALWTLAGSL